MLAAVNALGANQRELAEGQQQIMSDVTGLAAATADTNARVRSLEEGQSEIKVLLIQALDK